MRKLVLLTMLLAGALVVAAPAMAQSVVSVQSSGGSNASCSVTTRNGQTVVQVSGVVNGAQVSDTVSIAGPQVSVDCQRLLQQAAASRAATAQAAPAPQVAPAPAPKAELPKTGGSGFSLLGPGIAALLVAGGLLARRILR